MRVVKLETFQQCVAYDKQPTEKSVFLSNNNINGVFVSKKNFKTAAKRVLKL